MKVPPINIPPMTGPIRAAVLALAVAVAGAAAALAASLSLDVTPGLWQITTSGSASGAAEIPPELLARLSPDQRAMAEALAQIVVAQANIPHELRICVTPEQLRQGFDLNRVGHKGCSHTVQSSSPRHLDMHVECTGKDQMDGTVHVDALDHTTVMGHVDLRAGLGGTGLTIRQSVHGKWLGTACGDVQPLG